jgi:hypothetical protein
MHRRGFPESEPIKLVSHTNANSILIPKLFRFVKGSVDFKLDANELSRLLLPVVQNTVRRDCGEYWAYVLQPVLPLLLPHILKALQRDIDQVLDLDHVILSAFVRDKVVLVDLFQKVGRVELEFLVNSGFGFGFLLGLTQMVAWAAAPATWTLPVAGRICHKLGRDQTLV